MLSFDVRLLRSRPCQMLTSAGPGGGGEAPWGQGLVFKGDHCLCFGSKGRLLTIYGKSGLLIKLVRKVSLFLKKNPTLWGSWKSQEQTKRQQRAETVFWPNYVLKFFFFNAIIGRETQIDLQAGSQRSRPPPGTTSPFRVPKRP